MGRFINSSGRLVEGEVSVNTTQALAQMQPTLTLSTNGEFLVAWSTPNLGDTGFDVVGQNGIGQFHVASHNFMLLRIKKSY